MLSYRQMIQKYIFARQVPAKEPSQTPTIAAGGQSDKTRAKPLRPKGFSVESGREELLPEPLATHASNAE